MRYAELENAEIRGKHQFQGIALHAVSLFVTDQGIGVLHVFLQRLLLLHLLAQPLAAELLLELGLLAVGAHVLLYVVLGGLARELGEEPQVQERVQDALVDLVVPRLHHLGDQRGGLL